MVFIMKAGADKYKQASIKLTEQQHTVNEEQLL